METPIPLLGAVDSLVNAGEQAGFSVQQMIDLLDEGMSVGALLDLIARRLEERQRAELQSINFDVSSATMRSFIL